MSDQNSQGQDFQNRALGAAPKFAMSIAGLIIAISLALKLSDIQLSQGINTYIAAKARAVELEVENGVYGSKVDYDEILKLKEELELVRNKLKDEVAALDEHIDILYEAAHHYNGKNVTRDGK